MTAAPLIDAVRRAGGTIVIRGERLRLSAPTSLPDTLVADLRQHKFEILDLLRSGKAGEAGRQPPGGSPAPTTETSFATWKRGLSWPTSKLFGCDRRAPWQRLDGMGLVLLLRGKEVVALTADEAVIRTATGAHQTYRPKSRNPLHPGERCLVWELTDA